MKLAENTIVAGRFRLNRLIGQGGMGSVWQATHLGLDIPCAVKFIEGDMANIPEMQMRFEREAKAAAQLRSPHVVQILDHGISDGTPYIAMELLDGEDLGKRFAKRGRMAPAEIHPIIAQVCRALSKAHAVGIVHRDLKPDNIFLVRDDDREIAKVLDFGIAKSKATELGSNTKTGAMLGTPYFMSPEQAQGTRALDYRSDLWSLAVITFQGVVGRLPFESEALGDLLMKIMMVDLPIPSRLGCPLPGFDAWWLKAAARNPADRFQSAKEFSDSLAFACGLSQVSGVYDRPPVAVQGPAGVPPYPASAPATATPWGPPPGRAHEVPAGLTPSPVSRTFGDGSVVVQQKSRAPFVVMGGIAFLAITMAAAWGLRSLRSGATAAASAPAASALAATAPATSAPAVATDGPSASPAATTTAAAASASGGASAGDASTNTVGASPPVVATAPQTSAAPHPPDPPTKSRPGRGVATKPGDPRPQAPGPSTTDLGF